MNRRHSLPPEVYALVEQTPATVLLEGGSALTSKYTANPREEPWTQLFIAPLRVYAAFEPSEIPGLFVAIESAIAAGHTAAGFFSYECGSWFEPKAKCLRSPEAPLAWFGIYDRSYAFDHEKGEYVGEPPPGLIAPSDSCAINAANMKGALTPENCLEATFALSEAEYAEQIAAIHEWIRAGDVYQLNLTAPWKIETSENPAALYASLRARQPVDYGAFIHWQPGRHILSFSPELFFRVDEEGEARRITTRPMKGTAPRGRTTAEDRAMADWLRSDPKNRAENLMIVDLVRNDLGRLSRFGTVHAEKLFATERYATLWQMTSTVTGELRPEVGFESIFRALFPCGSITGAPKVRAMQPIAEIERRPRGVYTGAIGFFSPHKTVFNVAIRTLDLNGNTGTMGAGSGIVIDSVAESEYREVLLKAKFLQSPYDDSGEPSQQHEFSLIETMLWDGGFPLLELHLDRLVDSADYFDFPCDREEVQAALERYVSGFAANAARKVRLLLNSDGSLHITDEVLESPSGPDRIGRVRIAQQRTDPADPMLYHKTTCRPLYTQAFKDAAAAGFDDAIFLNLQGEVTEGAISNVFVEKNGRWLTPPIESGLLPGVYRRHLLETRPEMKQSILRLDDLRSADAVYLANAVRGLRRVSINWQF